MAGWHHFETISPPVTEENLYQKVKCIYCKVTDERHPVAMSTQKPTPLVERLYRVRTIPDDEECPKAP